MGLAPHDGSSFVFEERQFRVIAKLIALDSGHEDQREQARKDLAAHILDGLGGAAMSHTLDTGTDKNISADGAPVLG